MGEPEALFDVPTPAPLRRPTNVTPGVGKIVYDRYTLKYPPRCDDCLQVALEANRAGTLAPVSRTARFQRKQDGSKILLCAEHKHLREQFEREQAHQA